jgi:hypothetical protein
MEAERNIKMNALLFFPFSVSLTTSVLLLVDVRVRVERRL